MKKNNFLILSQGYNLILSVLVLSVISDLFISNTLSCIGYTLVLILAFIYRNPSRNNFTNEKNNFYSPIDGKIVAIDKSKNKQRIFINVNMCNTHLVTAPKNSTMTIHKIKNGLNLSSNTYKARKLNNQITLKFDNIKVKFISGFCNSNINFKNQITLKLGDEIGIFLEGLVIIELPLNTNINVSLNDKIYSNKTLLTKLD